MVLKDILAISGEQGLFKFIAQGKNAIIIEHIETGKRSSAFSSAKVSSLEEISIFTEGEDLQLGKVFDRIHEKESGGPAPDAKSDPTELKKYFNEVVPEYDKDRVYVSDIKKVLLWYNFLQKNSLLVKEEKKEEESAVNSDPAEPVKEISETEENQGQVKASRKKKSPGSQQEAS